MSFISLSFLKRPSLFRVLIFILFLSGYQITFSQANNVGGSNGAILDWNANSSWLGGSVPTASNTSTWANNRAGELRLWGSADGACTDGSTTETATTGFLCGEMGDFINSKNNGELDISYAKIRIVGNYIINNNFLLNLSNNAIFEVTGNIIIAGGADFIFGASCSGCKLIANNFSVGNSATFLVTGGGQVSVANDFSVGTGVNIDIDPESDINVGGDFTVAGGNINLDGCNPPPACTEDGTLNIGGTVNIPDNTITGDGTLIVTTDPNFSCTSQDPNLTCIDGTLPVELISFEGSVSNLGIQLEWRTLSEKNNDYFQVQRSDDAIYFYEIGRVNGNGTTNIPQSYSFIDHNPVAQKQYYRLNQVDFDGTSELHKVIVTFADQIASGVNFNVYPNPASDRIELSSMQPVVMKELALLDMTGKLVASLKLESDKPGLSFRSSIPKLKPGLYHVRYLTMDGQSGIKKLFIK